MTEHRLIAAMEQEIAAKIAEVERQADEAIRAMEAAAAQTLADAQAREESRLEEQRAPVRGRASARGWKTNGDPASATCSLRSPKACSASWHARRPMSARRDDYPSLWSGLFQEACVVYRRERTDTPIVRTSPADRPLAERQAAEVATIEVQEAIADGVELLSPDRRLRVVNTLAARLHRGRDEFLKMISDTLQERIPT